MAEKRRNTIGLLKKMHKISYEECCIRKWADELGILTCRLIHHSQESLKFGIKIHSELNYI